MVSVGMLQWVLTYLVHSTALIGAVWIATKLVPRTPLAVKETMWKVALLGGIFTASVQMASGVTSPWGDLPMPHALGGQRVAAAPAAAPEAASATAKSERKVVVHENGKLSITATRQSDPNVAPAAIAAPTPTPAAPGPWRFIVLGLLATGSIFAVARLVLSARALHKQLQGRRDVI